MTNDIRFLGTVLNVLLGALCFYRLHQTEIGQPRFVLYLCLATGFGWLLLGDLSYWIDAIDLGVIAAVGPGVRFTVFRILLLVGLVYVTLAERGNA